MLDTIKYFFGAVMETMGFARKRQELANSPEMQANERAKQDAKERDAANRAVKENDLNAIRRRSAE